jgi:hypothetical protein
MHRRSEDNNALGLTVGIVAPIALAFHMGYSPADFSIIPGAENNATGESAVVLEHAQ